MKNLSPINEAKGVVTKEYVDNKNFAASSTPGGAATRAVSDSKGVNIAGQFEDVRNDIALNRTVIGAQQKNLLKAVNRAYINKTESGVTAVLNDDGTVSLSGTATGKAWYGLSSYKLTLKAGTYILSGCPGTSGTSMYIRDLSDLSIIATDTGSGIKFTLTKETVTDTVIKITAEREYTTNDTFKPMVRYADITDSTYEPYQPNVQEQLNSKATSKILYSSDTGARTVTLAEAPSNYDYLMIFISGIGAGTQCITIPGSGTYHNAIITGSPTPSQSNTPNFIGVLATLSDTNKTVTLTYGKKVSVSSSGSTLEDLGSTLGYITKVTGFKSS
ncbi:MAG: hypothetical protein ACI4Q5_07340 [Porcipelethomonas sp.]